MGHPSCRVVHCVLLHPERSVLFRSFTERNVLLHTNFEFLAPYETHKKAMNTMFFCK